MCRAANFSTKRRYDVESEITQPAKVQEPSMEEILASIRRIIADDEAKPAAAEKPHSNLPKPPLPRRDIGSLCLLKHPPPRSLSRSCRTPPCRPSNPPSPRLPIPCSAITRAPWKIS